MAQKKSNNPYDITRDRILAPALVVHIDDATGSEVSGFGEGVHSFAILLRSMMSEDGTPGPARIAVAVCFVGTGSAKGLPRWVVGPNGACSLGTGPAAAGSCAIGKGVGRLSPHVSASLYPKVAAYATRVTAALAKRAKAA